MDLLTAAATIGLAVAGASHVASIALAMRRTARSRGRLGSRPPAGVSILRPVCGLEHRIEETLASSFRIDHPRYEVLFCVAAADDPVVPIVQRLIREHPESPAQLLVGRGGGGPNPKLDNLMKAWDVAAYDWIVLADSNVLISPDYLDRLFACWSEHCAVVCSPPVGIDVHGWAAELEAAFLNTFEARWQLAGDEIGFGFAQGKTMLLRRSDLAPEGGLAALAREVAEDAAATKFARRLGPQSARRGSAVCATIGKAYLRRRVAAPAALGAAAPAVVSGLLLCRAPGRRRVSLSSCGLASYRGRPAVGGCGGHDARLVRCRGGVGARLRLAAAPPLADALGRARPPAAGPLGPRLEAQGLRMARQRGRRQPDGASPICPIRHAPAPLAAALRLAPVDMRRAATRATCL